LALGQAGGLLADAVAPIGYAVRGEPLADDLRRYKSERAAAAEVAAAAARLREMLGAFLADRGRSVWAAAGMGRGPSAVAVVPSGQGRPGAHPLVGLVRSCVALPMVRLSIAPREIHTRGVNPGWVRVDDPVGGADILVVDDTWVSGGSAQSTAAALKLAGARRVAVVVLGRHVNPADPRSAAVIAAARNSPRAVP
jgi:phosphoribosylpyrophosphate synthetase